MAQNRSSAVMQQRSEAHDSLDDFPTPPWATRAICRWLVLNMPGDLGLLGAQTCREPCANRGYMVNPLREYFDSVDASDIHDYGAGFPQRDYLFGLDPEPVDWTFFNPPYRLAEQFIERARRTSRIGVAVIVRCAFTEGAGRYDRVYSRRPPDFVLHFAERIVMLKGRLVRDGEPDPFNLDPKTGKPKKASTATATIALIWLTDGDGDSRSRWIEPCRLKLERPGDYPIYDTEAPTTPLFDGEQA